MILSTDTWPSNAHLIAAVAALGYIPSPVLDATYGLGNFWTEWKPDVLRTNDLYTPAEYDYDFTVLPFVRREFATVVFDPPYKLNGTPSKPDEPYGAHRVEKWQDRMRLIADGTAECARVADQFLLVKCMDQVSSGAVRWQTDVVTYAAGRAGMGKVDQFNLLSTPRPQPKGRRQVHAARNYSTLLVFQR